MRPTSPRFQATYQGRSLWSEALDPPPGAIAYAAEYEYLEAARAWGYVWEQFDALHGDQQALIIAHWRTAQRIAAVDAWQQYLKRKGPDGNDRTPSRRRRR